MTQDLDALVERINALWHKKQSSGLTPAEEEEQKRLREKYLSRIRDSVQGQLGGIRYTGHKNKKDKR
ncbi:MAG TPA: DUF896 domain-containing protein [Firmicutes bacterium]|nr:DUF896 domain-containing protein [Bacillota bacterium]